MRIIAWNVAHQETGRQKYEKVVTANGTSTRLIVSAERLVNALVDLSANVAFLSEYRRSALEQIDEDGQLAGAGFMVARTVVTQRPPLENRKRDNQTLVAVREPFTVISCGTETPPDCALDNYCHIELNGLQLLGLRIPAYQGSKLEIKEQDEEHWNWLDRKLKPLVEGRSIVVGDMNRDPDSPEQSEFFTRMRDAGWRTIRPLGHPWSYQNRNPRKDGKEHRTTRIDHAFFGQGLKLDEICVQYIAATKNDLLTGARSALSDDAAIAVDILAC